jgi:non-ribosomal peptide synthetase component F
VLRSVDHLDAALDRQLRQSCTSAGRQPSAIVAAAVAAYVSRLSGVGDLVLGLPVTGRSGPAMRTQPGMLANVVPLRLAVRPDTTPADLIDAAGRALQKAALRQRHRGEDLARDLGVPGGVLGLIGPGVN